MDLTTATRVETLINPVGASSTPSDYGTLISQIIAGVSAQAEKFLDRQVQSGSTTEYLDVFRYQRWFRLKAYPVSAVTSVSFDPEQAFGSSTALTATTDYLNPVLDPEGLLQIRYELAQDDDYPRALKVVYTGGMAASAGAFVSAYPDIAAAIDMQCAFLFKRRNDLGAASLSSEFGAVSLPPIGEWLPNVRDILCKHRRWHAA